METSRTCAQSTKRHLKPDVMFHINVQLFFYSRFWYSHTQAYRFRAQPHSSLALCQCSLLFQFIREFHEPITSAETQNNSHKTKPKEPCHLIIISTSEVNWFGKHTEFKCSLGLLFLLLGEMKLFCLPVAFPECLKPHVQTLAVPLRAWQCKVALVPVDSGELDVSWHKPYRNAWTDMW